MKRYVLGLLIGSSVLCCPHIRKKSSARNLIITYTHRYGSEVTHATRDITNPEKALYTVESSGTTYKILNTVAAKTIFERLEREYNRN